MDDPDDEDPPLYANETDPVLDDDVFEEAAIELANCDGDFELLEFGKELTGKVLGQTRLQERPLKDSAPFSEFEDSKAFVKNYARLIELAGLFAGAALLPELLSLLKHLEGPRGSKELHKNAEKLTRLIAQTIFHLAEEISADTNIRMVATARLNWQDLEFLRQHSDPNTSNLEQSYHNVASAIISLRVALRDQDWLEAQLNAQKACKDEHGPFGADELAMRLVEAREWDPDAAWRMIDLTSIKEHGIEPIIAAVSVLGERINERVEYLNYLCTVKGGLKAMLVAQIARDCLSKETAENFRRNAHLFLDETTRAGCLALGTFSLLSTSRIDAYWILGAFQKNLAHEESKMPDRYKASLVLAFWQILANAAEEANFEAEDFYGDCLLDMGN